MREPHAWLYQNDLVVSPGEAVIQSESRVFIAPTRRSRAEVFPVRLASWATCEIRPNALPVQYVSLPNPANGSPVATCSTYPSSCAASAEPAGKPVLASCGRTPLNGLTVRNCELPTTTRIGPRAET